MGEWVFSPLLGGHLTLGKGIDGIAIETETLKNPTHTALKQTPCFKVTLFLFLLLFIDFFLKIDLSASSL